MSKIFSNNNHIINIFLLDKWIQIIVNSVAGVVIIIEILGAILSIVLCIVLYKRRKKQFATPAHSSDSSRTSGTSRFYHSSDSS